MFRTAFAAVLGAALALATGCKSNKPPVDNTGSVAVAPASATVEVGGGAAFTANATGPVTWSVVGAPAAGTIDDAGHYTAPAAMPASATVQISAKLTANPAASATATVTLVPKDSLGLESVSVTPAALELADGQSAQLAATGTYSNGDTRELTSVVAWTSSDAAAVTVGTAGSGQPGSVTRVGGGVAEITAAFAGKSAVAAVQEVGAKFVGISPATATVELDGTAQFTANASGPVVFWVVGSPATGTIATEGTYTAPASMPSSATVEVVAALESDTSITSTATITLVPRFTVGLVSIDVAPASLGLAAGGTAQLSATGHYGNGDTRDLTALAAWSSDTPSAVTVGTDGSGTPGLVTRAGAGTANVSATFGGKTGTATVLEKGEEFVAVSPPTATVELGTTQAFTVNASGAVSWSVTGGAANGTVASDGTYTAPATMPSSATVELAAELTANATVRDTATITLVPRFTLGLVSLAVTPPTLDLASGATAQLTVTGTYSNGDTKDLTALAVWSSSSSAAVTVGTSGDGTPGEVHRVGAGTAVVSAAFGGKSASGTVNEPFVSVSPAMATVELEGIAAFTVSASGASSWSVTGGAANGTVAADGTYTAPAVMPGSNTVELVASLDSDASVRDTAIVTLVPRFTLGLESVSVAPAALDLANGATAQLTATGHYANGDTRDLTALAAWSSSDEAAVTVGTDGAGTPGELLRVGSGTAVVTATFNGLSGTATVDEAFVNVAPASVTVELGNGTTFTATASGAVSWSVTGGDAHGTIDAAGTYTAPAAMPGSNTVEVVAALASDTTVKATATVTLVPRFTLGLQSISVAPAALDLANGATAQLTATGHYADASTRDLTALAAWSSSNASAVTVGTDGSGTPGEVQRVGAGTATITAAFGGKSGAATINPVIEFVDVAPASATVELGQTFTFTATASGPVTWSVTGGDANGTVDATGVYTAPATLPSSATVEVVAALTANASVSSKATVTLVEPPVSLDSVTVAPATISVGVGDTTQLVATGHYSDGSTADVTALATWSSDAESVATVGTSGSGTPGLVSAVSGGQATLTASYGGKSGAAAVTAVPVTLVRIDVSPATAAIPAGTRQQFVATAVYSNGTTETSPAGVAWTLLGVSPAGAASIDATGRVTATVAGGSATVEATLSGITGTATVSITAATLTALELNPLSAQVAAGFQKQLVATGHYSDGSRRDLTEQATWTPTTSADATVSDTAGSKGLVTAHTASATPVTISASFDGLTGAASITVTAPTLVSIDVQPSLAQIAKGTALAFTATGIFSDGSRSDLTTQVTWTSSSTGCATIDAAGVATGVLAAGNTCTTNVVAQHPSAAGVSGTTVLTVTNATLTLIDISPVTPKLATGATLQFVATGTFSDGSTQDISAEVVWSSSDTTVATISASGLATGVATSTSTTTITATHALNVAITDATTLTVTAATLQSISLSPSSATLVPGQQLQLTATGHYSDGSTVALTSVATWASSNTAVATVSNAAASAGVATGSPSCGSPDCGTTQLTATFNGVTSAPATLSLNGVTLTAITLSPASANLPLGYKRPYTAQGTYSDGSTRDLTTQVAWTSSNTGIATISNAAGSEGVATALAVGTVTVTATMSTGTGPLSGTASLTVNNAKISSITVTPSTATLAVGATLQLTAIATFNDTPATVLDVTTQVTWKFSPRNNAPARVGSTGLVTALQPGTSNITAQKGSKTATAAITVTP